MRWVEVGGVREEKRESGVVAVEDSVGNRRQRARKLERLANFALA